MYCSHCGKSLEPSARFCSSCGTAYAPAPFPQRRLYRPRYDRMIAGVCSGFSREYGWDISVVRIVAAALLLCSAGSVALAYFAAWLIIPEEPFVMPVPPPGGNPGVAV